MTIPCIAPSPKTKMSPEDTGKLIKLTDKLGNSYLMGLEGLTDKALYNPEKNLSTFSQSKATHSLLTTGSNPYMVNGLMQIAHTLEYLTKWLTHKLVDGILENINTDTDVTYITDYLDENILIIIPEIDEPERLVCILDPLATMTTEDLTLEYEMAKQVVRKTNPEGSPSEVECSYWVVSTFTDNVPEDCMTMDLDRKAVSFNTLNGPAFWGQYWPIIEENLLPYKEKLYEHIDGNLETIEFPDTFEDEADRYRDMFVF